jgi:trans-2,3-dihydro-3-hydroxyanthranilate isomerase
VWLRHNRDVDLPFVLLNVFAREGDPFSGNPLAVFPDAGSLATERMQAIARQLNLSETTFVTRVEADDEQPGTPVVADVRIFTPGYEMPFAGHPTLGTADVVAGLPGILGGPADDVVLLMPAGPIPVTREGDGWRLAARSGSSRAAGVDAAGLAGILGLGDAGGHVRVVEAGTAWVDVGVEQLLVQLDDVEAVRACRPDASAVERVLAPMTTEPHVYVWAWAGERSLEVRLFAALGGALDEDPATGSACANLGALLAEAGHRGVDLEVSQGAHVSRPSLLRLRIDDEGVVSVAGRVVRVGEGTLHLP